MLTDPALVLVYYHATGDNNIISTFHKIFNIFWRHLLNSQNVIPLSVRSGGENLVIIEDLQNRASSLVNKSDDVVLELGVVFPFIFF